MNESFELERINFFVTSVGEEGEEGEKGGKNAREKTRFDSKGFSLDETNARICYDSFSFSIKGRKKKIPAPNYLVRDYLLEIRRFFIFFFKPLMIKSCV